MVRARGETAELQRLDQIPQGMTEAEEDVFWETHSLGDDLLQQMEPFPDDFPLPPRSEQQEPVTPEAGQGGHILPVGKIVLSVAIVAGLVAVGWYIASHATKAGTGVSAFLPTRYPNLRISPAMGEIMNIAHAGARRAPLS